MNEEYEIYNHWEDDDFLNEIQRRVDDFESGREPGIPWEEVKTRTDQLLKKRKSISANPIDFDRLSAEELKKIIDECGFPPDDYN